MMTSLILCLPVAVAANWALVETVHHGSIFNNFRAWMEARGGFLGELFSCPFCLSHWTAVPVTALIFTAAVFDERAYLLAPVYWLAVVRVSNLCNDYFYDKCRTPRVDRDTLEVLNHLAEGTTVGSEERGSTEEGL